MGRNRSSWYKMAICIITEYHKNKKKMEAIAADYAYAHSQQEEERVQTSSLSGGALDVVQKLDEDIRYSTLKKDVAAVDYGLAMQKLHEDGEVRIKYITARYWKGMTSVKAARYANVGERTGQRINERFVRDVAKKGGYL